jgi:hypothetical protein
MPASSLLVGKGTFTTFGVEMSNALLPSIEYIEARILLIRGHRVMIDADLARFYGVTTKRLNEQVRRNRDRFPEDFMFQLSSEEKSEVVANCDHLESMKYSPVLPNVFMEHGALMLASVLRSSKAVEVSIYIVRAFVRIREMLLSNKELSRRLGEIEKRLVVSLSNHTTLNSRLFLERSDS